MEMPMNLGDWWRWPATILLLLAAVVLLMALGQGLACRRHWRDGRRLASALRAMLALVVLALALLLGGTGLSLRNYHLLTGEVPVARLEATRLGPQRWSVDLRVSGHRERRVQLDGDAFRVEAQVVKWRPEALLLAHAPPLYRLDRLSGRYDDPAQALEAPRTVVSLGDPGELDLWRLKRRFPQWLPGVDAVYGSGAYLPLVDGGRYRVTLMRSGALVARPADARTAAMLQGER
jgi:hypothetical protein